MTQGVEATDFTNFVLEDWKVTITRHPVIKIKRLSGAEEITYDTSNTLDAVFLRKQNKYFKERGALRKDADAYIMFAPDETMNRDDKIVVNGESYRVRDVIKRSTPAQVDMFKFSNLYLIT